MVIMLLTISFILLIPSIVYSETVCFNEQDSKKLVIELEKGKLIEKNLELTEKQNLELTKQTEILKEQLKLTKEQLQASQEIIVKNEELNKVKEESLQNEIKEAKKPRWGSLFGSFGLGALTVGLLILML